MESNGKSVHSDGTPVQISTSPVLWGGQGMEAQHAYFQLLHQGTHTVPVEFIGVRRTLSRLPMAQQQHAIVLQNLQAQAKAMALGRNQAETMKALEKGGVSLQEALRICPHRTYMGNHPSSTIWLDQLDPRSLGALIALYEHKVFCLSVLWGINAYDQWGVELGKTLASQMSLPDDIRR
jgi:glucose-6-phosphate isomerase